jgi:hypothetical protein
MTMTARVQLQKQPSGHEPLEAMHEDELIRGK